MEEIWKDIEGYEGLYQVSNLGNVRSLLFGKTKTLKKRFCCGYFRVVLYKNGSSKSCLIHRLMAQAFLPNPNNLKFVNHKDECKTNNFIYVNDEGCVDLLKSNLEWCDFRYNCNYGTRNERGSKARVNHPILSKPIDQYTMDGVFIKHWPSISEILRQLGFHNNCIIECCKGISKQSYGFIWRYSH